MLKKNSFSLFCEKHLSLPQHLQFISNGTNSESHIRRGVQIPYGRAEGCENSHCRRIENRQE